MSKIPEQTLKKKKASRENNLKAEVESAQYCVVSITENNEGFEN